MTFSYLGTTTRENLRDHMTPIELALISLGEATAIEMHLHRDSKGFPELKRDAGDAGTTAGKARRVIEVDLGRPVVSQQNYRALKPPQPDVELRNNPDLQSVAFAGIAFALGLVALKEFVDKEEESRERSIKHAVLRMGRLLYWGVGV